MRFRILGPIRVRVDGHDIDITASRDRALLATLLLYANRVVPVDRLIDAVWDDDPPRNTRNQLQGCVSRLRKRLGEAVIVTEPAGYRISVDPDDLDLLEFRRLVAEARAAATGGRHDAAGASYRAALRLWHGPALAGFDSRRLVQVAAALEEEHLQALQERLDIDLSRGAGGELVGELTLLVQQHPHREGIHRALMLALYRAGRQADALAAYQHARQLLNEELGIEPSAEFRQLHHAILNRDPALDGRPAEREAPSTPPSPKPRELPPDIAGFTGRTESINTLDELLPGRTAPIGPVVIAAISGTAGIGKTALAVHWAHRVARHFADGQLYINLRGYATARPLKSIEALSILLRSLGLPPDQIPLKEDEASARYRSVLADRRVLVVLDNARSVDQVRPLLPGTPSCFVLVTSRDRLSGLVAREGARRISLDVLSKDEACALLSYLLGDERVTAEPEAIADLATACAYLPLALRIAAALLDEHPRRRVCDLVAHLSDGNRINALALQDDQQSTMRATFDYSYQTLPEPAQRLFRLLGLVPGPDVTIDAAAALADLPSHDVRPLMRRLASIHLIEEHADGRYAFHDLLREYAGDRARADAESDYATAAIARLLAWYLTVADAGSRLLNPGGARLPFSSDLAEDEKQEETEMSSSHDALAYMDDECANLVAATEHAAEYGPRRYAWLLADRLRDYLARRLDVRFLTVGLAGLRAAEAEGNAQGQAAARIAIGNAYLWRDDHRNAAVHYARASTLAEQSAWPHAQAMAENNLALTYLDDGRPAEAVQHLVKAYDLNLQLGHLRNQGSNLGNLGYAWFMMGDLGRARSLWEETLAKQRKAGNLIGEATSLTNLGNVSWLLGRLGVARDYLTASLRLCGEVGDRYHECYTKRTLASVLCDAGQAVDALSYATEAVSTIQGTGAAAEEAFAANALATVYRSLGRYDDAIACCANALDAVQNVPRCMSETLLGLADTHRCQGDATTASEQAGRALEIAREIGNRVTEGRALTVLAEAELDHGRTSDAHAYAELALENHRDTGHRPGIARTLAVLGTISHATGDLHAATRRWQAASDLFEEMGARVPADIAERLRTA